MSHGPCMASKFFPSPKHASIGGAVCAAVDGKQSDPHRVGTAPLPGTDESLRGRSFRNIHLKMKAAASAFSLLFSASLLLTASSFGQAVFVDREGSVIQNTLSLPYAFYNENFGMALGYVYGIVGRPQKQSTLLATGIVGSKGSAMGFLMGSDLQMPLFERLFVDPIASVGYFEENEAYIPGNPDFPFERAGSNDSHEDNFVTGDGWDNLFRINFKYLLPIGQGADQIISTYRVEEGLLISGARGGASLNPLESGKTYLELRPFYRWQQIEGDEVNEDLKTNGLDFAVYWDNRDFHPNPSRGFSLLGQVSQDFGWLDSSNSWTDVSGELDFYVPFQLGSWLRQGVIAMDIWTSYSPSWDEQPDGRIDNRPPAYTGSTLGGLWRMRGFPTQRFNDKAAVYYSTELRMIPHWNPFQQWEWIQKHVGIQWLQFAPFLEVGRVAPDWSMNQLHSNMQWNAGLGIRAWAKAIVLRIDTAYSEEGVQLQMMVSQPFQF